MARHLTLLLTILWVSGVFSLTPSCQVTLPDISCVHIDQCSLYTLDEALKNASSSGTDFTLRLERSVITDFPQNIFRDYRIVELHVRYSILETFPHASFANLNANLKKLDLSYNTISALNSNSMKNLPFRTNLGYLSFYQNAIKDIVPFAFVDFPYLTYLDLSRNLLTSLPDYAFGGLSYLNELQLSGNQISAVGPLSFSRMDKLSTINLGDNWIATLTNGTFNDESLPSIANVWLPYNIFNCNCNLQWLKDWLTKHDILEDSRATCETPQFATFSDVTFCGGLKSYRLQGTSNHHHNSILKVKEIPT